MRKILLASALGPAFLLCAGTGAPALGPTLLGVGTELPARHQAPANPDAALQVTPQCGTWMVLAATYQGPDGPEFALTMAWYIRRTYNLPAYVYSYADAKRRQDNDEELRHAQQDPAYVPKFTRVEENCGVLIGGFADQAQATALLKKIRTLPFPDAHLPDGRPCYRMRVAKGVTADGPGAREDVQMEKDNPFQIAIVCRNPTVAAAAAPKSKFDPAWPKLNAEEEYSVFKCPRPWTLAVKQYAGMTVSQSIDASGGGILDKLWPTKHEGVMLNAAAFNAHELAKTLRKLGFDAYVLHTRNSSVVTVGAFAAQDDKEMDRVRERLAALRPSQPGVPDALALFPYPAPMEVPHQ
jgi:hypothetical protein